MEISTMLLTTVAECDSALDVLNAEKTQVQRRLRNQGEALESRSVTTQEVSQGIIGVQAVIAGYEAALQVMTDEKAKRELELKVEREETRLKALQNRQANYSTISVIEGEVDYNQLEARVKALDDAIDTLTAYKATL